MLMTEEEAKTKWCPFSRVAFGHMGNGNRVDLSYTHPGTADREWMETKVAMCNCIASRCGAWRLVPHDCGPEFGFCGLAGRTE